MYMGVGVFYSVTNARTSTGSSGIMGDGVVCVILTDVCQELWSLWVALTSTMVKKQLGNEVRGVWAWWRTTLKGLVARKIRDKNADIDSHVVLQPEYPAGGDSKRKGHVPTRF